MTLSTLLYLGIGITLVVLIAVGVLPAYRWMHRAAVWAINIATVLIVLYVLGWLLT